MVGRPRGDRGPRGGAGRLPVAGPRPVDVKCASGARPPGASAWSERGPRSRPSTCRPPRSVVLCRGRRAARRGASAEHVGWRWVGPAVVAAAPLATISSWPAVGHRLAGRRARPRRGCRPHRERRAPQRRRLRRRPDGAWDGAARARAHRRRRPVDRPRPRGRRAGRARGRALRRPRRPSPVSPSQAASTVLGIIGIALGSATSTRRLRLLHLDRRGRRGRAPRPRPAARRTGTAGSGRACSASPTCCAWPRATSTSSRRTRCRSPRSSSPSGSGPCARRRTGPGSVPGACCRVWCWRCCPACRRRSTSRPACGRSCSASAPQSRSRSAPGVAGRCRSSPARSSWRLLIVVNLAPVALAVPRWVLLADRSASCSLRRGHHLGGPGARRPRRDPLRRIHAVTHCCGACITLTIATQ